MTTHTNDLDGRIAVVTGATSGIGAATARRLTDDGATVAVVGRREDRLKELAADIGAFPVAADVADQDAVNQAAEAIRAELGRVDLVVANAGVMYGAPFASAQTGEWDRMINTNLNGLLYTGRAFVDDLVAAAADGRRSDLVHVGSVASQLVINDYGVYSATKAAVAHLTRNLRAELAPQRVRVKNVEPGVVVTELGDGMASTGNRESLAAWRESIEPLVADDIAEGIAYAVAVPPRLNVTELIMMPTNQV